MSEEEKRVVWSTTSLMCDECGKESEHFPINEELIGKQCVHCQASMLTQAEYDQYYAQAAIVIEHQNKLFGGLDFMTCTEAEATAEVRLKIKPGHVKVKR